MIIPKINNDMDKNMELSPVNNEQVEPVVNEQSGVHVQGHIKIFDPETNEIFVEVRA